MDLGVIFTKVLAIATVLGNIFTLFVLFAHVGMKDTFQKLMQFLSFHALRLGFLLAIAATFGSLAFSQVMGYQACILCWTQRIFMYPLAALFALALWRNDRAIFPYALFLSVLGGAVALYNWVKDMLLTYSSINLTCPVVPGLPSCDIINMIEFGYVTIPMLALNAFILIAFVSYAAIRVEKRVLVK